MYTLAGKASRWKIKFKRHLPRSLTRSYESGEESERIILGFDIKRPHPTPGFTEEA